MINHKFTVIIPTRERSETLYHTIKTCLNQTYENYKILISDNFSQGSTKEVVESFNDKRIRYINTNKRCSMSENFEFVLSYVKDGYLMFIGDDDGVLPNSLDYVNHIINETKCEAVVSHNAFYTWPDSHAETKNGLYWSHQKGYEIRNSQEWIKKYLTFKMQYTFDLPGAYCGFVHRGVFDRVTKDNIFFRSPTPDAYSALAIAFATESYVYSHTAFAVHGSSSNSNGGSYGSKKTGEEGKESVIFFKENTIPFHSDIIFSKAMRISSLEAFLQFSDVFPELTKNHKVDWELFLKYVLTEATENTQEELEAVVKKMCVMHGVEFSEIQNFERNRFQGLNFKDLVKKIINRLNFLYSKKTVKIDDATQYGVYNVYDAMLLLNVYLFEELHS